VKRKRNEVDSGANNDDAAAPSIKKQRRKAELKIRKPSKDEQIQKAGKCFSGHEAGSRGENIDLALGKEFDEACAEFETIMDASMALLLIPLSLAERL
jgi:hypothetical protein